MNFKEKGITTPKLLMQFLEKSMKYGFTYRGQVFTDDQVGFQEKMDKFYKIRLGEDFVKNGYGVCWDFCEFGRTFFEEFNIPHECYFIYSFLNNGKGGPTHTFALYKQDNKWFWFEYSWQNCRGIWQYNSKKEALLDIQKKFYEDFYGEVKKIDFYKFEKVKKRLNVYEFVDFCMKGRKLKVEEKEK